MAFRGLQIPFKARKKGLKNDDITSFSYSFYDFENPRTNTIATAILNALKSNKLYLEVVV